MEREKESKGECKNGVWSERKRVRERAKKEYGARERE